MKDINKTCPEYGDPFKLFDGLALQASMISFVHEIDCMGGSIYDNSVTFSPDGESLAFGTDKYSLVVRNISSGKNTSEFTRVSFSKAISFSCDGELLAYDTGVKEVKLWNILDNTQIQSLPVELLSENAFSFK